MCALHAKVSTTETILCPGLRAYVDLRLAQIYTTFLPLTLQGQFTLLL